MAIKRITVSNFRSFEYLDIELGKFNVLIGANASGKSNFIEIFKFLRDIASHDLDDAISIQGGVRYLRNITIGPSRDFSLKVVYDPKLWLPITKEERFMAIRIYEVVYEFALKFAKKGTGFRISEDKTTLKFELAERESQEKKEERERLEAGEIVLANVGGNIEYETILAEGVGIQQEDLFLLPFLTDLELSPRTLLLETPFFTPVPPFAKFFDNVSIYDFDPRLSKRAVAITGKTELEEDGRNLAVVLKNIIAAKDNKRKFYNLLRDLLPFVDTLNVAKFAERSLLLRIRETYSPELYLPAYLISDGTINITALIIASYFEEKPVIIIEEPERNIHPYLISKVVEMLKEASEEKQIIVTTHNPEIVRHADLPNLLLISRDKEGFSTISRPGEKEVVKTFLENEIGVEELYIQNLLGI